VALWWTNAALTVVSYVGGAFTSDSSADHPARDTIAGLGAVTADNFSGGALVEGLADGDGAGALVDGDTLGEADGEVSEGDGEALGVSLGVVSGLGLWIGWAAAARPTLLSESSAVPALAARGFGEPSTVLLVFRPGSISSTRRPSGRVLPCPVTRTSTPLDGPTQSPWVPPRLLGALASRESGASVVWASTERQPDHWPDEAPRVRT